MPLSSESQPSNLNFVAPLKAKFGFQLPNLNSSKQPRFWIQPLHAKPSDAPVRNLDLQLPDLNFKLALSVFPASELGFGMALGSEI